MVGLLEDVSKYAKNHFTNKNEEIILIGEKIASIQDDKNGLAGSEYLSLIHNLEVGIPTIDLELEKGVHSIVRRLIQNGLVTACHDCSDGGLVVALTEMAISGPSRVGCGINLPLSVRFDTILFGERQSRIIVTATPENAKKVLSILTESDIPHTQIGKTGGDRIKINNLIDLSLADVAKAWSSTLEEGF